MTSRRQIAFSSCLGGVPLWKTAYLILFVNPRGIVILSVPLFFIFNIIRVFLAPAPKRACLQPSISPNARWHKLLMRNSACYITPYAKNPIRTAIFGLCVYLCVESHLCGKLCALIGSFPRQGC
ncbi:unnamed protein product [Ascophyllum nodosum]